jgi:hypothetical protein
VDGFGDVAKRDETLAGEPARRKATDRRNDEATLKRRHVTGG